MCVLCLFFCVNIHIICAKVRFMNALRRAIVSVDERAAPPPPPSVPSPKVRSWQTRAPLFAMMPILVGAIAKRFVEGDAERSFTPPAHLAAAAAAIKVLCLIDTIVTNVYAVIIAVPRKY